MRLWLAGKGLFFVVLFLGQTACSDMLGLGDLSYTSEPTSPATGGAVDPSWARGVGGTGGDDGVNFTAGSGGTMAVEDDYPAKGWAADSILVAAPPEGARSTYYRYEPSTRTLFHYEFSDSSPDLRATYLWGGEGDPQMTHVVAVPTEDGKDMLIGYDATEGWKQKASLLDETLAIETEIVNSGYTHYLAASWSGEWFTVAYDRLSGEYRWVPALKKPADVSTPVTNGHGNWGAGWTVVRGFDWSAGAGLLLMKPGEMELYAFPEDSPAGLGGAGSMEPVLRRLAHFDFAGFGSAPTQVQVVSDGGTPLLFFYDEDSGLVEVWQLQENEGAWSLAKNYHYALTASGDAGGIRRGLTTWAFVDSWLEATAITFDGRVGAVRFFGPSGNPTEVR